MSQTQTQTNIKNQNNDSDNIRFTTLINPLLLSKIKLISYISNKKLYDIINLSIQQYIDYYNKTNNTNIDSLINLQQQNNNSPTNPNPK
jgi:hypothetical protein